MFGLNLKARYAFKTEVVKDDQSDSFNTGDL